MSRILDPLNRDTDPKIRIRIEVFRAGTAMKKCALANVVYTLFYIYWAQYVLESVMRAGVHHC
jgi:hypothetical protein